MADRAIYTDADAVHLRARAGQSYCPSSGAEGAIFETAWCAHNSDGTLSDQPESCPILTNTMAFSIDDPDYPPEWIYGPDGQPRCTAFVDCHDARTERCRETADLFSPSVPTPASTEVA